MKSQIAIGDDILVQVGEGVYRPGKVVGVWTPECVNAVVFMDGTNDQNSGYSNGELVIWKTSILEGVGADHWQRVNFAAELLETED